MIPIKLALRNFMPYQDNVPPLSFDGLHTACISGNNGSGKSSLIDAMTWALWGQARTRSDDDLIHSGKTEMEVEFDFTVGQNLYRIVRKHSKSKTRGRSGQTILEFQTATGNSFKSITGNSLTQTQQKIIDVLHMDYETFKNSAYLRQGHADEFTLKKAADRKQVLADILGLDLYDKLEEQAKELAKHHEENKDQLQSTIKEINNELAVKPAHQAEFEQVQSELSRIEAVIKEQETRMNRLRQEKERLENKKSQLTQLDEHVIEIERDLERWNDQLVHHRLRLNEYEDTITQRAAIEEGYTRFIEAKNLCDTLEQKFRQSVNLEKQKSQLDNKIRDAGQSLLTNHAIIQNNIVELEASSQRLPALKNDLHQAQAKLHHLTDVEEQLRRQRQSSQELQTYIRHLESDNNRLEQEIGDIEEKLKLLLTQAEAKCPLCETELGVEGIKLIETKYDAERSSKSSSWQSSQIELANKKAELETLEGEISRIETKLSQDRSSVQSQAIILNQTISEIEVAGNQLNEARNSLADIEQHLARRDFAPVEQRALEELESELAELDYDPQRHEQARQRLSSLKQHEDPKRKLEEADRLFNQEKEDASRAEAAIQELRHSLETDNQKRQGLSQEIVSLPQLVNDLTQAETVHQELNTQQKQAQEILWSVKAKLQRIAELEIKKAETEKQVSQASREEDIYRDLAKAFGKKGVQALLIETALPEIEAEANKLLGRMTDNRMHVKIETQRETKKGDVLETLDINISDELGRRNYEMFSGGESFRINFAIRIALSKLLARRAGAPLPTLIIDEGFGTQDDTGIEKIKEAINSIQDDFQKIFVITHMDELRDAFPARINVIKNTDGSTIEVS